MVVYYRGQCTRITHDSFTVYCPSPYRLLLRELSHLRALEQNADAPALAAVRSGSTSVAGAMAVALAAGPGLGSDTHHTPAVSLGLLLVLVLSAATTGACWRFRRIRYALVAAYRGRPVTLFDTTNEREFRRVERALVRALQRLDDAY